MNGCKRIHVIIRLDNEKIYILNILSYQTEDGTYQLSEDLVRYLGTIAHMSSGTKIATGVTLAKAIFTLPLRYPDHPDCKEFVQAYLEMADRLALTDVFDNDYLKREVIAKMARRTDSKSLRAMLKNCTQQIITSTSLFHDIECNFSEVSASEFQQLGHLTKPLAEQQISSWQDVYQKQVPSPPEMPDFPKIWNRFNAVPRINFGRPEINKIDLNEASETIPFPKKTNKFDELINEVKTNPVLWNAFKKEIFPIFYGTFGDVAVLNWKDIPELEDE